MPIYEVACNVCGEHQDIFRKIADYNNLPDCCGERTHKVLTAAYVPQEFQPYKSMIDGRMITDRGEHRRHLKANGCVEVGNENPAPKPDLFKQKRDREALRKNIAERVNSL